MITDEPFTSTWHRELGERIRASTQLQTEYSCHGVLRRLARIFPHATDAGCHMAESLLLHHFPTPARRISGHSSDIAMSSRHLNHAAPHLRRGLAPRRSMVMLQLGASCLRGTLPAMVDATPSWSDTVRLLFATCHTRTINKAPRTPQRHRDAGYFSVTCHAQIRGFSTVSRGPKPGETARQVLVTHHVTRSLNGRSFRCRVITDTCQTSDPSAGPYGLIGFTQDTAATCV